MRQFDETFELGASYGIGRFASDASGFEFLTRVNPEPVWSKDPSDAILHGTANSAFGLIQRESERLKGAFNPMVVKIQSTLSVETI